MGPFNQDRQPDVVLYMVDVFLASGGVVSFLTHEPSFVLQKLDNSVATSDPLEYEWIPPSGLLRTIYKTGNVYHWWNCSMDKYRDSQTTETI